MKHAVHADVRRVAVRSSSVVMYSTRSGAGRTEKRNAFIARPARPLELGLSTEQTPGAGPWTARLTPLKLRYRDRIPQKPHSRPPTAVSHQEVWRRGATEAGVMYTEHIVSRRGTGAGDADAGPLSPPGASLTRRQRSGACRPSTLRTWTVAAGWTGRAPASSASACQERRTASAGGSRR